MKDGSFSRRSGIHHAGRKHIHYILPLFVFVFGFRFYSFSFMFSCPFQLFTLPSDRVLGQIKIVETRALSGLPHRIS